MISNRFQKYPNSSRLLDVFQAYRFYYADWPYFNDPIKNRDMLCMVGLYNKRLCLYFCTKFEISIDKFWNIFYIKLPETLVVYHISIVDSLINIAKPAKYNKQGFWTKFPVPTALLCYCSMNNCPPPAYKWALKKYYQLLSCVNHEENV